MFARKEIVDGKRRIIFSYRQTEEDVTKEVVATILGPGWEFKENKESKESKESKENIS